MIKSIDLADVNVVVLTESPRAEVVKYNQLCREKRIGFIAVNTFGYTFDRSHRFWCRFCSYFAVILEPPIPLIRVGGRIL